MDYLNYLVKEIHTVVASTVDKESRPVTCAIDLMDYDEEGLYFLSAKGKGFYRRLMAKGYVAMTGLKGRDTLSSVAISLRGYVKECDEKRLKTLLDKNPYMYEIYPSEESRFALTAFCLYQGEGECFSLSKKPIERASFSIGKGRSSVDGYEISSACISCKSCQKACPQGCIDFSKIPPRIEQEHCLRCGNCFSICPFKAVLRRE